MAHRVRMGEPATERGGQPMLEQAPSLHDFLPRASAWDRWKFRDRRAAGKCTLYQRPVSRRVAPATGSAGDRPEAGE
jgi:hypothetical protein